MAYKRWYDFDQRMSTVVRAMEKLSRGTQIRFAEKLLELSEEMLLHQGGQNYLTGLDEQRLHGLQKATTSKARWYDRHETLRMAFLNLYALTNDDRRAIAARMLMPVRIIEGYERSCKSSGNAPDFLVIEDVLHTCFRQGAAHASKLYSLYLSDSANLKPKEIADYPKPRNTGVWTALMESLQTALS